MDPDSSRRGLSGDLCQSCGLCCSGVLFDWVPVATDERDRLTGLGFLIEEQEGPQEEGEEARFAQPCPMFHGQMCTVYANRPARCARYRCELLKKVDAGEVPLREAMERVAQARALLDQVKPMLQPDSRAGNVGQQWAAKFREWQSRPSEQRADDSETRLILNMTLLNRLLDQHFRSAKQRRIMEE